MSGPRLVAGTTWDAASLLCACQYGACGYCSLLGRHERCTANRPTRIVPAAFLTDRQGGQVLAEVWETGHDHRWVCACHRRGHGQVGQQLDLFAPDAG